MSRCLNDFHIWILLHLSVSAHVVSVTFCIFTVIVMLPAVLAARLERTMVQACPTLISRLFANRNCEYKQQSTVSLSLERQLSN